ncbi:CRISPR-associated endonuclease Cas2 [Candidatus Woesearchaeota archaeon CG10_big_fil_rev_8_21_14_0_10_37_12]|nr:MAG: CRISPR-associated endonuclease Cas2 [Candidatus Woesearchaeota archaeon CG10_big_fil_rev_8_21_14_0_10_37_12]
MIILTYDIQDDHLRTEFSKFILSYGRRLQYSVYEIKNSKRILEIVQEEIKNRFEKRFNQGDSVLIFKITAENQISRFGYAKNEETDLLMY